MIYLKKTYYLVIIAALHIIFGALLMPADAAETQTDQQKCVAIADFSRMVVTNRDNGIPRYQMSDLVTTSTVLDVESKAAFQGLLKMVYDNKVLTANQIGDAAYDGCMKAK